MTILRYYHFVLTKGYSVIFCNTNVSKNKKGVERRNEISATYKKEFLGKVKFQDLPARNYNAHHLFIIEVENRKEPIMEVLRKGNNFLSEIFI